ncbi:hypothetical protein [Bifidobacterium sp. ESL0825]|uniref:hypothetical protein n=1 Tax=Bifidobacterium sp. ESL0825 TaxID=3448587 RepID=UPI00404217FA
MRWAERQPTELTAYGFFVSLLGGLGGGSGFPRPGSLAGLGACTDFDLTSFGLMHALNPGATLFSCLAIAIEAGLMLVPSWYPGITLDLHRLSYRVEPY